jgi:hypothetical protein
LFRRNTFVNDFSLPPNDEGLPESWKSTELPDSKYNSKESSEYFPKEIFPYEMVQEVDLYCYYPNLIVVELLEKSLRVWQVLFVEDSIEQVVVQVLVWVWVFHPHLHRHHFHYQNRNPIHLNHSFHLQLVLVELESLLMEFDLVMVDEQYH